MKDRTGSEALKDRYPADAPDRRPAPDAGGAVLKWGARLLFPLLVADFVFWWTADIRVYTQSLKEDASVEYLTVWCLLAAAALSLLALRRTPRWQSWKRCCYLLVMLFCAAVALEEISWGQRLLGIETPSWFAHHSTQREINAHNVFQKWTGIKARHVASGCMLLYGVILPFLSRRHRLRKPFDQRHIPVPPRFLALGFLLAVLAMIDLPTGREEEIGECFFSICLLRFMTHECLPLGNAARQPQAVNTMSGYRGFKGWGWTGLCETEGAWRGELRCVQGPER